MLVAILCVGCTDRTKRKATEKLEPSKEQSSVETKMFSVLGTRKTGIHFINKLPETDEMNGLLYEYYYNGAGTSLGDFNNDGLVDIFFVSNLQSNHLYLNQGNMRFKEVGRKAHIVDSIGFPTGSTVVDINNDGRLDIYVSKSGKYTNPLHRKNRLYINMGNDDKGIPNFKEAAAAYNLDIPYCSTQAAFFDYDLDGDLDMFLINHQPDTYGDDDIAEYQKQKGIVSGERLYKNNNGWFVDVTESAGIINNRLGYGLGVGIGDVNNDNWPDVYVSNDFSGKDHLYINQKNGTFKEVINTVTKHISFFSMGNDIADYNNDGLLDIMSVDMSSEDNYSAKTSMSGMDRDRFWKHVQLGEHLQYMYNALQLNRGTTPDGLPKFSDVAQLANVSSSDWSWGPLFMDMDNDGYKDLFVSNGIKRDFRNNDFVEFHKKKQAEVIRTKKIDKNSYISEVLSKMPSRKTPNYFFKNNGDLTFTKKNGTWADDIYTVSNGAAYADMDNDGDLDIVINNMDAPAFIYKNNAIEKNKGNFLKIKLVGPKYNSQAIGSKVILKNKGNQQILEHYLTRGFQSSVAPGLHFGLGQSNMIDQLEIIWPGGKKKQTLTNIKANQLLTLNYNDAEPILDNEPRFEVKGTFEDITLEANLDHLHIENQFDDFDRESLLPHKMSQFGPALAVGDINNDGLDDFYVGGATGQLGALYIQKKEGTFESIQKDFFENEKKFEDVAAVFFDGDGDGDVDLYVVSGGNEDVLGSKKYEDRLYENVNGVFKRAANALPKIYGSGSCVKPFDYDNDGDLDLFVGGRQVPGRYPMAANSYILHNKYIETGRMVFEDLTNEVAPKLERLGMVTDAIWVDIDNDKLTDLIVVGEWMPITILKNMGGFFEDRTKDFGLSEDIGWWFSIAAADFDNDGDIDLVGGNLGLNYKYKANKDEPFEIYTTDFDESGDLDIVLGYYNKGNLFPLRGRECSSNEIPFIKKKFPTYDAFGKATLVEVYGNEKLKKATHYSANNFANSYFENKGDGSFKITKLPMEAQVSSVNAILVDDVDGDGNKDLILAGNLYGSEVETPRNDASYGIYLKGDGKGGFISISQQLSGLYVEGEVRRMLALKMSEGRKVVLVAINNKKVILLE